MPGHGGQWVILLRGLSSVGVLRLWWLFGHFWYITFHQLTKFHLSVEKDAGERYQAS